MALANQQKQTEQKRRNQDSNHPEQKRPANEPADRSDEQMRHKKDRKIDRETGAETADSRR
jgi:hypothetical protein